MTPEAIIKKAEYLRNLDLMSNYKKIIDTAFVLLIELAKNQIPKPTKVAKPRARKKKAA